MSMSYSEESSTSGGRSYMHGAEVGPCEVALEIHVSLSCVRGRHMIAPGGALRRHIFPEMQSSLSEEVFAVHLANEDSPPSSETPRRRHAELEP
jgi:hypothetical protein